MAECSFQEFRFGCDSRTDFSQFFRVDSCRAVSASALAIISIVSITRVRIAALNSVSGIAGPLPNRIQLGDTLVISAIASMILRFGFLGSVVSSR